MTCNMTQRLISAYVDRELSEDERERVRQHLALCADCMAVYEATLDVKTALSLLAPSPCPACVWESVRDRIEALPFQAEPERTSAARPFRAIWSFARLVVPAAIAGTIVAIPLVHMIFGVSLFGPSGPRQQPMAASTPPRLVISSPTQQGVRPVALGKTAGISGMSGMSASSSSQFGLGSAFEHEQGGSEPGSPDSQLNLLFQRIQDTSLTYTWIGGSTNE